MSGSVRDVVLVIGDPLVPAAAIARPLRERLPGSGYDVVEHDWDIDLEAAVEVNRAVESGGPTAVDVELGYEGDRAAVVGVVTQFHPLPARVLARWPRLSFVATLRAGTENVDTAELSRRGVVLVNNAGRNANAVAEFTVAAMLGHLRRLGECHHAVRQGGWRPAPPPEGYRELAGMTVGLIGFGAVGSLVARRLSGFDTRIVVSDPWTDLSGRPDVEAVALDALLPASDIVSLHARLTPETRHLVDVAELDALRSDALLVNTARAELVNEDALVERLLDGRIGGAALDVFSTEPLPADHPLRRLATVSLSPHLAGATVEASTRAPELLADRILRAVPSLVGGTPEPGPG